MLDLFTSEYRPATGWTRRQILRAGFLGLGSLTLADLLRLRAQATDPASREGQRTETARPESAVILLWVGGGPSHLETYDLKPEAPDTIRSIFRPIGTRVQGLDVCELLPEHARLADKLTIFRSLAHDEPDHGIGTSRFLTGYPDLLGGKRKEVSYSGSYYPSVECGANRYLGRMRDGMPVAVDLGGYRPDNAFRGPGIWGAAYQVPHVPSVKGRMPIARLKVPAGKFADRVELLGQLERVRAAADQGAMAKMDVFQRQAFDILTSGKVSEAFDLNRENAKVRERYGPGWPQELLAARRLVEAGVRFVSVNVPGLADLPDGKGFNWDDHAVNWDMRTAMQRRLPRFDRAVGTLIEDIYQRGLNERVLLVITGEFGRTPRLESMNGKVGRDHYPWAMSIVLAGGGRQRGNVVGATDGHGARPKTRRYDPHDFLATIYQYLGIDPHREYTDTLGRPLPLTRGTPIAELI
jgi:hypothetical protein